MGVRAPSLRRLAAVAIATLAALGIAIALLAGGSAEAEGAKATSKKGGAERVPTFTLDPGFPKALPNNWVWGGADSLDVDRRGHVWVLSRPLSVPAAEIAAGKLPAPPVVELDEKGRFVQGWGGPGWTQPWFTQDLTLDYPLGTPAEHGIYVDDEDNVWLTGSGHIVLKFSRNGVKKLQIGVAGQTGGSNSTTLLGNPTDIAVDTERDEVYVSDGYVNRRVIVFDSETGAYKRHWGAYGNVPNDDPPELYEPGKPLPDQFFIAHGIGLSRDGLLYVADRQRNRVQVFERDGTFADEVVVDPQAPAGGGITVKGPFTRPDVAAAGFGSVTRVAFSADKAQTYLYAASLRGTVYIIRRKDLETVGSFPATGLHHITTDNDGNVLISDGRSPQRYLISTGSGKL